jgi:predicted metal-dependent HD superfamily phosphohydrolase
MSSRDAVRAAWNTLTAWRGCAGPAANSVLDGLEAAYGEQHRAYHTLEHIAMLLRLLDEHDETVVDREAVVLAILFHDAIYDPARRDNEEASAELARVRLTAVGIPEATIDRVAHLIVATQHGSAATAASNDTDLDLLLDLDLSILAAGPEDYRAYAQAIRQEFALYPDEVYRPGRRRVLEYFLSCERIYRVQKLRDIWEAPARANIVRELAKLA